METHVEKKRTGSGLSDAKKEGMKRSERRGNGERVICKTQESLHALPSSCDEGERGRNGTNCKNVKKKRGGGWTESGRAAGKRRGSWGRCGERDRVKEGRESFLKKIFPKKGEGVCTGGDGPLKDGPESCQQQGCKVCRYRPAIGACQVHRASISCAY